jgi:putative adenylate-forming enzyme
MSCKLGSLHINEDLIYVQTLNSDGTPTPPGEPCYKMIITDLHRTAQPIVRYELNDLIITSPYKCECGSSFRVIEQILGRSDDLFWARRNDNGEMQFIFPDYIRRAIISSSEEIEEYQAIQKNYSKVVIHIVPKTDANKGTISKSIEEKIQQVFRKYNCKTPKIEVIFKTKLERDVSQKIIRISRDFDVSF